MRQTLGEIVIINRAEQGSFIFPFIICAFINNYLDVITYRKKSTFRSCCPKLYAETLLKKMFCYSRICINIKIQWIHAILLTLFVTHYIR